MNLPNNGFLLNPADKATLSALANQSLVSIAPVLERLATADPRAIETFEKLAASAVEQNKDALVVAMELDINVDTGVAACLLASLLSHWHDGGRLFIGQFLEVLEAIAPNSASATGTVQAKVLNLIGEAVLAIAGVENVESLDVPVGEAVPELILKLAILLREQDQTESALSCALSAGNWANLLAPHRAEPVTATALAIARDAQNADLTALCATRHAQVLGRIAKIDPRRRLDAFDAFEAAVRRLPKDRSLREPTIALLRGWLSTEPYLYLLQLILLVSEGGEELQIPESVKEIAELISPVWEKPQIEWFERMTTASAWAEAMEVARYDLESPAGRRVAETNWATWSIDHPGLHGAVPHGSSVLREDQLDDFILVLSHEVIHVYSMAGIIGLASLALRWVQFMIEVRLWVNADDEGDVALEETPPMGPAPLFEPSLLSLARAEQSVELERKTRLLEQVWAPWFEGLAVFGALAADPTDDAIVMSLNSRVIYNLLDTSVGDLAKEKTVKVEEAVSLVIETAELLYREVMMRSARHSLRDHLITHHEKYLAGYLTVRSVVSAWRRTLGRPLSGAEAFRILLHTTRFGDGDAIPNLGLPYEQFEREAVDRQLNWLDRLVAIECEELDGALEFRPKPASGVQLRWEAGHLHEVTPTEESTREVLTRIEDLLRQAFSSQSGRNASRDRASGAGFDCKEVMGITADALALQDWRKESNPDGFIRAVLPRLSVLPLGTAPTPFWLLTQDLKLACLIRTRLKDQDQGKPSYDLVAFPLPADSFSMLLDIVRKSGETRMKVTRVVDLQDMGGRESGRHYLVYQLHDWIHIQPRGWWWGTTEVVESLKADIISRLEPNAPWEVLSSEDHPCAARTKRWIEENDWRLTEGDLEVDVSPWAAHVSKLADSVLTKSGVDSSAVNLRLLTWLAGDEDVARLLSERGLSPVAGAGTIGVRELIETLDASARSPLPDSQRLRDIMEVVSRRLGSVLELTTTGWDVSTPRGYSNQG